MVPGPKGALMSEYNPYLIRRAVRLHEIANDGILVFVTKSFTSDSQLRYHPIVDLVGGMVTCDCPHFTFRLAPLEPTLRSGPLCKHLQRAVDFVRRHGLLPIAREVRNLNSRRR
jgi:hypothetical protein